VGRRKKKEKKKTTLDVRKIERGCSQRRKERDEVCLVLGEGALPYCYKPQKIERRKTN